MKEHIKNAYKFLLPKVLEITANLPADHLGELKELAAIIETNCTAMLIAIDSGKLPENVVATEANAELQKAHQRIEQLETALKEANTDVQTLLDNQKTLNETIQKSDLTAVVAKLDLIIQNDGKVESAIDVIEKHATKTNEALKQIADRLLIQK